MLIIKLDIEQEYWIKYFYCDNDYDIFAYYQDGVHEITKEQYIDFNRGKLVSMSLKREDGQFIC